MNNAEEKPETRKRNPVPDPRGKMRIQSSSLFSLPESGPGPGLVFFLLQINSMSPPFETPILRGMGDSHSGKGLKCERFSFIFRVSNQTHRTPIINDGV